MESSTCKKSLFYNFVISLVLLASFTYAGVTHVVYGELQYSGGGHPASVTWNAYITSRPAEVLNQNSPSSLYNAPTGHFIIDCWAFSSNWQSGDVMHVDFNDGSGSTAFIEVSLTNDPQQDVGVVTLGGVTRQVTVATDPAGLQFIADGTAFTGPHTFSWSQGSVHTLDVNTPQSVGISGLIYEFDSWSNVGTKAQNYTVPGSDQTLTVSFDSQEAYASTPHIVGGYLVYENGTHPATVTWTAYITLRPDEIITQASAGSKYDGATSGGFLIQCAAFSQWTEGEVVHINFTDGLGNIATREVTLTTNPGDLLGTVTLVPEEITTEITITTNPSGLQFIVDGIVYTAPYTFVWDQGSVHSLDLSTPQLPVQPGIKYVFASWSDAGEKQHNYTVPGSNQTLTAMFTTQYYLTISSMYGNPQGEGWYNSGASAQFNVTTPVAGVEGTQYAFTGWLGSGTGSYSGAQAANTIIMNNPVTETAGWKTQYLLNINVNPVGGGTITPDPYGPWYDAGALVSLYAIPASGYQWSGWSGNLTGNTNPANLLVDAPKAVTAQFVITNSDAPELVYLYPADSSYSVPINSDIQFKVEDTEEGVNPATLDLTVNGTKIIDNGVDLTGGKATLTTVDKACIGYYKPASNLSADSWIVVNIQCQDKSSLANMMNETVMFQTGAGKMTHTSTDTLDASGGIVYDDSTEFALYLPYNALANELAISISLVDAYPQLPAGKEGQGSAVYFGPAGLQLADSVTITIPYDQEILDNAGVAEAKDLSIYYYSMITGEWSTLKLFDPNQWNVFAKVTEFCYLVYGGKVESLSKPGRPAGQTDLLLDNLYGFETTAAHSTQGHAVEYRFSWGDGSFSSWNSELAAAHKWTAVGNYGIVAFARSKVDTTIMTQSDTLHVTVRYDFAVDESAELPAEFCIEQNYPNPFNPETTIRYQVPVNVHVIMQVYNVSGQKICTLVNEEQPAGSHSISWDGRNDAGMPVSAGLYFVQMRAGSYVSTIRMAFLK